jgi:sterol desaturase/sphingolipid hydroxylase (fatty acid hydroxylase superfamily)
MGLLALEHSRAAYRADFACYGVAVVLLAAWLVTGAPPARAGQLALLVAAGLAAWTLAEYAVHRFVLHGLQPFRRWHAEHHRRPRALVYTPTVISAASIGIAVTLPALLLGDRWTAGALTLGMTAGCLGYACAHHALHRSPGQVPLVGPWLRRRARWHALHHATGVTGAPGRYGVTTGVWDRLFGTTMAEPG